MPKAQKKSTSTSSPTPTPGPASTSRQLEISSLTNKTYNGKLKAVVTKVCDGSSGESSYVKVILADTTGWIRASIPATKADMFVVGNTVHVKGFTVEDQCIRSVAKYFTGGFINIPDDIRAASLEQSSRPIYPVITIEYAQQMTVGKKVSVKGTVVTNRQPRTAMVKGRDTLVREIELEDQTAKMFISLWRESCNVVIDTGDELLLKDITLSSSKFHGQMIGHVNTADQIEVDQTPTPIQLTVCGVDSPVKQDTLSLLCEVDDEDIILTVSWATLCGQLNVPVSTEMKAITTLLPTSGTAMVRAKRILHFTDSE